MRESNYQARLVKVINTMFPGCLVLQNDANLRQGIPDLVILHGIRWAALEVKAYEGAPEQPNQDYYVGLMHKMSYAAFIYPENEEAVLYDLQHALQPRRTTRVSQRK